jgi:hypothetical protein
MCIICPREKLKRPKKTMENDHFFDLVCQSKEMGAKTISPFGYGEPLIDPKIAEKIGYCSDLGLETFITTNGSLLTKRAGRRILEAGLSHIRFSVHGFENNYESIHRGLNWRKVSRNILDFLMMRGDCKASVSVIPMHGETVDEIRNFWEPMVDWLEIWKPHNWTNGRDYRQVLSTKTTCGRPKSGPVQIQSDGKMIVCCFDYNGVLEVGDTNINTIGYILRGDKFNAIRKKHKKGDLDGLICKTCDQLNEYKESPLLYSSRDNSREVGYTSSIKFKLGD